MVEKFHAAGIEVILDVVYNHTAEGNQLGPTICFRGVDNASYYRLVPDNPRFYMDYTGTGNTLNAPQPAHPAAHHGQPALLDPRDARGRLPLRPRVRAGPRAARRGPPGLVLRHHPPGPGDLAGQAHRGAVGRRRGRLPGGQLPAPVVGVERQVPRHRARLLARGAEHPGRVRVPLHGQLRPLRGHRPPPLRQRQLRHRPRRLHRSTTSSPTTRSTTRPTARTTATGRATTARGTAAPRGRPTTPRSTPCARGRSGTSWPR